MLLTQTLVILAITALMTYYVWLSYILFFIFLGGMLVLPIHITSLASNEMFQFSFRIILLFISILKTAIFLILIIDPLLLDFEIASSDVQTYIRSLYNSQIVLIRNIHSSNTKRTTLFIIVYLLLTLIVFVKITYTFWGPLQLSTTYDNPYSQIASSV